MYNPNTVKYYSLLIIFCLHQLFLLGQLARPSPRLQLPSVLHCLDDVTANLSRPQPGILVRNDIDDSSFVTGDAPSFFLGHLTGPGLYSIREDSLDFHYFVFSCRDHDNRTSLVPLDVLPRIQQDSLDLAGVLDTMRVEMIRGDSAFLSDIDSVDSTVSSLIDSGQTMKFGVFFDKAAGYIALTIDTSDGVLHPDRDKLVAVTDSFFIRFFRRRHPDRPDLNNRQWAVIDKAMNKVLPPGTVLAGSPNVRYSKYLVDDLLSTYRRLPISVNSALAAVAFEKKYFEQVVLLFSIYKPSKVRH